MIGADIANAREARGISQGELSRRVNDAGLTDDSGQAIQLTISGISRIENGNRFPNVSTLQGIAHVLGIYFTISGDGIITNAYNKKRRKAA